MRRFLIALIALAGLVPAVAAAADWREIARFPVFPKGESYIRRIGIAAPVEHLQLRAEGGDIHCLTVRASFRDDKSRVIFAGDIAGDHPVTLALEGGDTSIRQLRLRCSGPDNAELAVIADIGRFEGEWAGDSSLARAVGVARSWGSTLMNDWALVGGKRFESRYAENRIEGPGAPVTALALKPLGRNARCRAGSVTFEDGTSRKLDLDRDDFLAHDLYFRLQLPAEASPLEAIDLECRATNGGRVMIQVFADS
jgi:hypothetical protein